MNKPLPRQAVEKMLSEDCLDHIRQALEGMRYGSVEIIVHEARVVQIERREKFRLPSER